MYATGRGYTLQSLRFGSVWCFNLSVTSNNGEFIKSNEDCSILSLVYVRSEKDMMPLYVFVMHMEHANQMV